MSRDDSSEQSKRSPAVRRAASRALAALAAACAATLAVPAGTLEGVVTAPEGAPVEGARVVIIELNESRVVESDGTFRFENVPDGSYHVQAARAGLGSAVAEVELRGRARVELKLDVSIHREQIVVTASRTGRGSAEVVQPVGVLDGNELAERLQPTLGETLASEPGISSTYFGPGSSRPVIRGQGGGRVRVLEGGVGVGDASTTSPDHAVATDVISAERVEILRGPASLLYGSAAVGGVVNVIDARVPERVPHERVVGSALLRAGSAAGEASAAVALQGGAGRIAWYADALSRDTDDLETPAGTLAGSDVRTRGATLGASWISPRGFVGLAVKGLDSDYGIPFDADGDASAGEEGPVRIDLEQRRADVRGAYDVTRGPFDRIRFSVAASDYEHRELVGGEPETLFLNESRELRVELLYGSGGTRPGVVGLQLGRRDSEAIGDEAFVPPSVTDTAALFALQEIEAGAVRFELGARLESQSVDVAADGSGNGDFEAASASAGFVWTPGRAFALGVSLARTERLPSAEELYSNGPHLATGSFEIGDPSLDEETSLGLDVSLRRRAGRVTGELTLFAQRYDDFIFETPTSMEMDGLPVFRFEQRDAEFIGAELGGAIHVYERDDHHLDVSVLADVVRAELADSGEPLPRIPPRRAGADLRYRGPRWNASVGVRRVARQDRVAPFETPTGGYTTVAARVGLLIVSDAAVHELTLAGSNLSDRLARNHASRLKDVVPLPGRDVSLTYRLAF